MINRALSVAVGLLAITIAGCSDRNTSAPEQSTPEPETEQAKAPVGLTISNAMVIASPAAMTLGGTSETSLTYVSAAPGTFSDAASLTIRNQTRNGSPVTVTLVNGGFDPVAIAAEDNDVLQLVIVKRNGETSLLTAPVPPRRPPVIVRTNPPKGATDVPLNARMTVVFSEPMDAATLTAPNIGVRLGATAIAGDIEVSDDGLMVEFVPAVPLLPSTTYALSVSPSLRDREGNPLTLPAAVSFTTVHRPESGVAQGVIAFVSDRAGGSHIFSVHVDGTNLTQLTSGLGTDATPTWSPDGKRIAFVRTIGATTALFLMNHDGSGLSRCTEVGTAYSPAWSPDGRHIAFSWNTWPSDFEPRSEGFDIHVVDATECTMRPTRLTALPGFEDYPAWTPDGRRITFITDYNLYDFVMDVFVMNADGTSLDALIATTMSNWKLYFRPSWSPDGTSIVMDECRTAQDRDCLDRRIVVADATGRNSRTLVTGEGAAWSPDGDFLAYAARSCATCAFDVRYVSRDGTTNRPVVTNAHSPTWRRE